MTSGALFGTPFLSPFPVIIPTSSTGRLADQYGGKMVMAFGVSVWSLCTVATPWAANRGGAYLIACRVLLGVGEGVSATRLLPRSAAFEPGCCRA